MKPILQYSNPQTKEQIACNIVYFLRENSEMEELELFTLGSTLDASASYGVRWSFLEKITPKLNEYVRELWKEHCLEDNEKEIKRLESMLKEMI